MKGNPDDIRFIPGFKKWKNRSHRRKVIDKRWERRCRMVTLRWYLSGLESMISIPIR